MEYILENIPAYQKANNELNIASQQYQKEIDAKMKEAFAKSIKKELKTIKKDLLKDASYQEELVKFFDQPDMQKQLESILKGSTMRKELEKVVQETIENPLMQTKWQELIRKSGESGSSGGSKDKKESGETQSENQ